MSSIGSPLAGSFAGATISGQEPGRRLAVEQADQATKARELRKLADTQQHEVENTERAEMESVLPDERRQRRRRRKGTQIDLEADEVELSSAPANQTQGDASSPPNPTPPSLTQQPIKPGQILDVQA